MTTIRQRDHEDVIFDSGASRTVLCNRDLFTEDYRRVQGHRPMFSATGHPVEVNGIGFAAGLGEGRYTPGLPHNLLSTAQDDHLGLYSIFGGGRVLVVDKPPIILGELVRYGILDPAQDLYKFISMDPLDGGPIDLSTQPPKRLEDFSPESVYHPLSVQSLLDYVSNPTAFANDSSDSYVYAWEFDSFLLDDFPSISTIYPSDPNSILLSAHANPARQRLLHSMIGPHAPVSVMNRTMKAADGLSYPDFEDLQYLCPACIASKAKHLPVPRTTFNRPAARRLTPIVACTTTQLSFDAVEVSRSIKSWQGNRYFTLFKDKETEMEFIYFHPDKTSWQEQALRPMLDELTAKGKLLDAFKSDSEHMYWTPANAGLVKSVFPRVRFETSPPGRQDFNGYVEAAIRTLVGSARAVIIEADHLGHACWQSAMLYCVEQRNKTVTSHSDITPYERWTGHKPSYARTVPFGVPAYVHLQPSERTGPITRLQSKARLVSILREAPNGQPGYEIYDPHDKGTSGRPIQRIKVRYDVYLDPAHRPERPSYLRHLTSALRTHLHGPQEPSTESNDDPVALQRQEVLADNYTLPPAVTRRNPDPSLSHPSPLPNAPTQPVGGAEPSSHLLASVVDLRSNSYPPGRRPWSPHGSCLSVLYEEDRPWDCSPALSAATDRVILSLSSAVSPTTPPILTRSTEPRQDRRDQRVPPSAVRVSPTPMPTRGQAVSAPASSLGWHGLPEIGLYTDLRDMLGPEVALSVLQTTAAAPAAALLTMPIVPTTDEEAMASPDRDKWIAAKATEMAGITAQKTWIPAPNHTGRTVKSRWAWRVSREADGSLKHRARIVAKGYTEIQGVDYLETFAPTISTKALLMMLHIVASEGLIMHNLDVSNAYLEAETPVPIFMELPRSPGDPPVVVQLLKTLYGLKESGHEWNKKLDGILRSDGYIRCFSDPCLYWKRTSLGLIIVGIHVDDMLYAATVLILVLLLEQLIGRSVRKVKLLGDAAKFVGLELARDLDARTITITQESYITDMLASEGMSDVRPARSPASTTSDLLAAEKGTDDSLRPVVGKMRYATDRSQPGTLHQMSMLASTQANPGPEHTAAAQRLMAYFKYSKCSGVVLGGAGPIALECWVDASHREDGEARSQLGMCMRLNPTSGMFYCRSQRDNHVAFSSAEAELRAYGLGTFEVLWARYLLEELGFGQPDSTPIYEDNEAVTTLMATLASPAGRTKHVNKLRKTIQQYVDRHEVDCIKVPGEVNIADLFTKNLDVARYTLLNDMACGRI